MITVEATVDENRRSECEFEGYGSDGESIREFEALHSSLKRLRQLNTAWHGLTGVSICQAFISVSVF